MNKAINCGAIALLLLSGCARGIDREKFVGVYRAGQDLQGATSVGVTLVHYRELLASFASQVAQANDAARTERERLMVGQYAFALDCYRDAGEVWTTKIEHSSPLMEGLLYVETIPNGPALIQKYSLSLHPSPFRPDLAAVNGDEAMQEMWRKGRQGLAIANTAYTGKTE